jgi:hypothetical protein
MSHGSLEDSSFEGSVHGRSIVGGLVGSFTRGNVERSSVKNTDVSSQDISVGGLVGSASGEVTSSVNDRVIRDSFTVADVRANRTDETRSRIQAGGLIGYAGTVFIERSYSLNSVLLQCSSCVGGGLIGAAINSFIRECFSKSFVGSNVATWKIMGGLVGENYGSNIFRTYANGVVSAQAGLIAGLVGYSRGKIEESYADGKLLAAGSASRFGLVASSDTEGRVINSYWNSGSAEANSSSGGIARTARQMKLKTSFDQWVFVPTFGAKWELNSQMEAPAFPWAP